MRHNLLPSQVMVVSLYLNCVHLGTWLQSNSSTPWWHVSKHAEEADLSAEVAEDAAERALELRRCRPFAARIGCPVEPCKSIHGSEGCK